MVRDPHAAPLPDLFDSGPMPAVISRISDNTVVAINVRTAELFEVTQKDLAGARVSDYYANPIERAKLAERIQRDGRVDNMRIELRRPGGGTFWALASSRLISVGGELCIFTVFSDISEQVEAEERLRASERRLAESEARARIVINTAPDAFIGMDSEGMILQWNAEAERTFGWTHDEVMGRSVAETIIPPTFREAHVNGLRRFHETGEAPVVNKRLELVALHKRGHEFPIEITITSPVREGSGYFFGAFLRDISDRRERDAQLRLAKEAAESATRAKSEFLANMSHELRTPLNGVLGYAQLLRRDRELTSAQREAVEAIAKGGAHLLDLITDVLDLSKIEAGRVDIETTSTNLTRLTVDLEHLLAESARRKGLTLTMTVLPDTPRTVMLDGRHLRQVLVNLVGNAIKFTSRGEVRLIITVDAENRLLFEVWDTGPGIESDALDAIFEAFTQTKAGATVGGTGLGLTISQQLLQLMGGRLQVESVVGEGSRFHFTLPLVVPESAASDDHANDTGPIFNPRLAAGYELLALVVDDSTVNRRILAKLLESAGVQVITAAGGNEGIELASKHRPGVVFMDLKMPDLDGLEATRRLRANPDTAHIPVIAVTASAFGDTRQAAREAGCTDYLPKPVRAEVLYAMLHDRLGARFVHEDGALAAASFALPDPAQRSAIAARLHEALAIGAVADLESLARELAGGSLPEQALGRQLARMTGEFDFDGLASLARALASPAETSGGH
jgi:two-component system sensor histidine kinase/response regulator